MATDEEQIVFKTAIENGCCSRCGLRYISERKTSIEGIKIFSNPEKVIEDIICVNIMQMDENEKILKKLKRNSCAVCLGILQDPLIEDVLSHHALNELEQYEFENCVMYIGMPKSISIRERSMEIFLMEKFSKFYEEHDILPINKAWRWSIEKKFTKITKKEYNRHSQLFINFFTSYPLDEEESVVMKKLTIKASMLNKKKYWKRTLSRHDIKTKLDLTDNKTLRNLITVPPKVPIYSVSLEKVDYSAIAFIAAGTYCKYSRFLFQQPGVFDGATAQNDYSISNIITRAISKILNHKSSIEFKTGGIENYNVRVLGGGRPFYVQINDPKFKVITYNQFRQIEEEIKTFRVMEVKNLQLIAKHQKQDVLSGDANPKTYNVLCKFASPENLESYISIINKVRDLRVHQKTPLKRFNRKIIRDKEKVVHYMKVKKIEVQKYALLIEMLADSGLYIEEFISGDEGRTVPSLQNIINGECELVELDIIDIVSTLPTPVDNNDVHR